VSAYGDDVFVVFGSDRTVHGATSSHGEAEFYARVWFEDHGERLEVVRYKVGELLAQT
jgi:hypothetical protein